MPLVYHEYEHRHRTHRSMARIQRFSQRRYEGRGVAEKIAGPDRKVSVSERAPRPTSFSRVYLSRVLSGEAGF
jgi:hypothetical protein